MRRPLPVAILTLGICTADLTRYAPGERRLYDARGARIQICNRDILERGGRLLRRLRTRLRELCSLGHDLQASPGPESSGYTSGPFIQASFRRPDPRTDTPVFALAIDQTHNLALVEEKVRTKTREGVSSLKGADEAPSLKEQYKT